MISMKLELTQQISDSTIKLYYNGFFARLDNRSTVLFLTGNDQAKQQAVHSIAKNYGFVVESNDWDDNYVQQAHIVHRRQNYSIGR